MKQLHNTGLRETLRQLPAEELRAMLNAELERPEPDPEGVRMLLAVLEEQAGQTQAPREDARDEAWENYQNRVEGLRRGTAGSRRWMMRAASLAVILGLLVAVVPQSAQAETFWEMLQRMGSTVISYFSREDSFGKLEYPFETDNPGLQQVHDAVVALGVTEPVVPMWLPEGSIITELVDTKTPMKDSVFASFSWNNSEIIYELSVYQGEPAHQFYRDDSYYDSYERNGATFHITKNNNRWVAVWTKDNFEGSITLDCPEETLRSILKSVYVMEE